jgi:hypothetical protein
LGIADKLSQVTGEMRFGCGVGFGVHNELALVFDEALFLRSVLRQL